MKTRTIASAIVAAALGIGSLAAVAQSGPPTARYSGQVNNDGNAVDDNGNLITADHPAYNAMRGMTRANGYRPGPRGNDYRNDRYRSDNFQYGARGPEWRRGGYVPRQYRDRQYIVNDWRAHHLSAPPHGYQWAQVGSDYVLFAIATGLIAQLLINQ